MIYPAGPVNGPTPDGQFLELVAPALLATGLREWSNRGMKTCPFCNLATDRIYLESEAAIAFPDAFPISQGHTLVVPKRHVTSLFDLSDEEQAALWRLVAQVRAKLWHDLNPDAFSIGVNDGRAAGQTVLHGHVHIIPRRQGDSPDPRGGIRWIKPEKARYWGEGEK
jgi:diadenosine tetraphosphate (Ap4A) HIT family hydrolase